jgi:hypothetical protein
MATQGARLGFGLWCGFKGFRAEGNAAIDDRGGRRPWMWRSDEGMGTSQVVSDRWRYYGGGRSEDGSG